MHSLLTMHNLNSNMVDIFDIAPQDASTPRPAPTPFAYAGQEDRIMRYQNLLAKLAAHDGDGAAAADADAALHVDWLEAQADGHDLDVDHVDNFKSLQRDKIEARTGSQGVVLVGTFADAAAAMA